MHASTYFLHLSKYLGLFPEIHHLQNRLNYVFTLVPGLFLVFYFIFAKDLTFTALFSSHLFKIGFSFRFVILLLISTSNILSARKYGLKKIKNYMKVDLYPAFCSLYLFSFYLYQYLVLKPDQYFLKFLRVYICVEELRLLNLMFGFKYSIKSLVSILKTLIVELDSIRVVDKHEKLILLAVKIQKRFSSVILLSVIYFILNIIMWSIFLIKDFWGYYQNNEVGSVVQLVYCLSNFGVAKIVVSSCQEFNREADKFTTKLQRIIINKSFQQGELDLYLVVQPKAKFTAMGFFVLDNSLIFSVVAVLGTYFVIATEFTKK